MSLKQQVDDYEKNLIESAMKECNGNKTEAAKLLNMKRTTLVMKLKKIADEK